MTEREVNEEIRVSVEPDARAADVATVETGLRAFNVAHIGDPHEEPVRVFLRDARGDVVGGLIGHIKWRWMYVAKLWIADEQRGRGHGAALLAAAERYAQERRCTDVFLDTFEYQARPFYEKLGYRVIGTLEGFPPGYRQYFLTKSLRDESSDGARA